MNLSKFTEFLKNRNFTSKIKRSKVTDYAALNVSYFHEQTELAVIRQLLQELSDLHGFTLFAKTLKASLWGS